MEKLGRLLANQPLGHEGQATIKAAAIISAASQAVQKKLRLSLDDARAVSYRRQEVIIHASHGGVAGQIMMYEPQLLKNINDAVQKIYPSREPAVRKIIVRQ
jgi:tRNA G37 N-methylase TrmD